MGRPKAVAARRTLVPARIPEAIFERLDDVAARIARTLPAGYTAGRADAVRLLVIKGFGFVDEYLAQFKRLRQEKRLEEDPESELKSIAVRLDARAVAVLDEVVRKLQTESPPGVTVTQSHAVRFLLVMAFADLGRFFAPTPGASEPEPATRKRARRRPSRR